eukprot:scaffold127637_cov48-Phaeocystis_antarctica.AAC.1
MPHAPCPMPDARCLIPNPRCPMPKYAQSYDLTQVHGGYAHPEGDMGGESGLLESLHVTKLGLGLGLGLDLGLACLRACTCSVGSWPHG